MPTRPTWTGTITFGLVAIPVTLNAAVRSASRVSFHFLHKKDMSPIRNERVCEAEDKVVPWSEIVKGYEYKKGKYIALSDAEFAAAGVESSKTIEITSFVPAVSVDPRYFETPYYLAPAKGGEHAYALLREAMRHEERIGIGQLTMRANAFHLVGIRVVDDAMVLEIMRFADELVDPSTLKSPTGKGGRAEELTMARQLVNTLASDFDPSQYTDTYHDNLKKIIKDKLAGKTIDVEEPEDVKATPVIDLVERLRESLAAGKKTTHATKHRSSAAKRASHAPARHARKTRKRAAKSA